MKVAVVTPTIGSDHLAKCIESVQNQSYENLTHYIFLDGEEHYEKIHPFVYDHCGQKTIKTIALQIPNVAKQGDKKELGEEYTDCLLKIVRAITNKDMLVDIREDIAYIIRPYTEKKDGNSFTMKARFALLDVIEKVDSK